MHDVADVSAAGPPILLPVYPPVEAGEPTTVDIRGGVVAVLT